MRSVLAPTGKPRTEHAERGNRDVQRVGTRAPDARPRASRDAQDLPARGARDGNTVVTEHASSTGWQAEALQIQSQFAKHTAMDTIAQAAAQGLCQVLGATQVAVAWRTETRLNLVASAPNRLRHLSAARQRALLLAMDEACDQQIGLSSMNPGGVANIVIAQRALAARSQTRQGLAMTVPLARGYQTIGAITAIWSDPHAPVSRSRHDDLMAIIEAIAPALSQAMDLAQASVALWPKRLRQRLANAPESSRKRRRWLLSIALAATILAAIPFQRHVNLDARIHGAIERKISATSDSILESVSVRPGDTVRAGQIMAILADRDLSLKRDQLGSELAQYQGELDAAMAGNDRTALALAQSRIEQTRAQLARHEALLADTEVRAPIDGIVLEGDLWQAIGTPVTRGQSLFTVAPKRAYRVVLDVDESQRTRVQTGIEGTLRLNAIADLALPFVIDRVAPTAQARDDRIVFEAQAKLDAHPRALQAGMRGVAQIRIPPASLLARWFERLGKPLREFWWRWRP